MCSPLSPPRLGIERPLSRHRTEDGKTFRYRHITRGMLIMGSKTRANRNSDSGEEKEPTKPFSQPGGDKSSLPVGVAQEAVVLF